MDPWRLKSQRIEYQSNQKLLQQILGPEDLRDHF